MTECTAPLKSFYGNESSNPPVTHYRILRACLWFAAGEEIECKKFLTYFQLHGMESLMEHGYIKPIHKK